MTRARRSRSCSRVLGGRAVGLDGRAPARPAAEAARLVEWARRSARGRRDDVVASLRHRSRRALPRRRSTSGPASACTASAMGALPAAASRGASAARSRSGLAWTGSSSCARSCRRPSAWAGSGLGYYSHAQTCGSRAARAIIGVEGLTLRAARRSAAGSRRSCSSARRARGTGARARSPRSRSRRLAARARARACRPVDGPRVLLVQPGFTQHRKQHDDPAVNLALSLAT